MYFLQDVSEEGSYNLSQGRSALQESLQSRYLFKEEQPNSLSQSSSKISFRDDQPSYTTVSESSGTYQDIHSFSKDSYSSSSLLSAQVFPRESTKTVAVGLMRGLANHIDRSSLADTAAETSNSYVDGNTSASSSPPPVLNSIDRENNFTDPKFTFPISDDDNMRLRFNNKRHRNGIPLCQYEAFKPTRFNQFKENDDVSWKDLPDISSPRKKSAISKDNPVIGKRLARDESPQRRGENTANQKYEEKIRLLQQQRLKERSRRRNNSARAEYCGEQGDAQFSKISDTPPPYTNEHRDISTPSLPPYQPPPYYLISDEGDSVAVKLSDFALVSSGEGSRAAADRRKNNHARRHETTVTGSGRTQHSQTSSPVGFNRFNGFDQQHNTASHYFNHTRDQSSFGKSNVLQTSVLHNGVRELEVSGSGVSSSTSTPQVDVQRRGKGGGNGKYHKSSSVNNHVMSDVEQRDDFNHSNRPDYKTSVDNNVASFTETHHENQRKREDHSHHENQRKREDHSGKYLNYPKSQIQEPKIRTGTPEISFEHERVTFGRDYSLNTSLSGNQRPVKNLLPPNNSVHHVTVTSRNISRPVSPRLVMAVDGKNVSNDLTFKEFLPGCAVEDVTSFLVSNINDFAPQKISRDNSDHTAQEPVSLKMTGSAVPLKATGIESGGKDKDGTQLIQEQVSMDCDVEEVTRNISKHLVEFCKVQDVESDKDVDERSKIKVRVTDLDMPDAACPLSRNGQHENEFEGNGRCFQVLKYLDNDLVWFEVVK